MPRQTKYFDEVAEACDVPGPSFEAHTFDAEFQRRRSLAEARSMARVVTADVEQNSYAPNMELALLPRSGSSKVIERVLEFEPAYDDFSKEMQKKALRADSLTKRLEEKSAQLTQMSAQVAALQGKGESGGFSLERQQIEISGLEEQARRLKAAASSKREELAQVERSTQDLEAEKCFLTNALQSHVAKRREVIQTEVTFYSADEALVLDEKQAAIHRLREQIQAMNGDLAAKNAEITGMRDLRDVKCRQLEASSKQLQQLEANIAAKEAVASDKAQLQGDVHRLLEELRERNAKLVTLSVQLAEERALVEMASTQAAEEEGQVLLANETEAPYEERRRQRLEELQATTRRADEMLAAQQLQAASAEHNFAEKQALLKADAVKLEGLMAAKQGDTEEANTNTETATRVMAHAHNVAVMLTQTRTELADKRAELAGKNTEIRRLQGAIEGRVVTIEDLTKEIEHLQSDLAHKKEALLERCDEAHIHHIQVMDEAKLRSTERIMSIRMDWEERTHGQMLRMKEEMQRLSQSLILKEEQLQKTEQELLWEAEQHKRELRSSAQENEMLQDMEECLQEEVRTKHMAIHAIRESIAALEKETKMASTGFSPATFLYKASYNAGRLRNDDGHQSLSPPSAARLRNDGGTPRNKPIAEGV